MNPYTGSADKIADTLLLIRGSLINIRHPVIALVTVFFKIRVKKIKIPRFNISGISFYPEIPVLPHQIM